jgi:hypothetical protein
LVDAIYEGVFGIEITLLRDKVELVAVVIECVKLA